MAKFDLNVKGMTCSSCEILIERSLKQVSGVKNVHVSRAAEKAVIECSDDVKLEQLQQAVKEKGYILTEQVSSNSSPASHSLSGEAKKKRYKEIGAVIVFIFAAYLLLQQFNIFPENFGVTDNMSYGFVFVLGLIAATSTCLAVSGGLLIALAGKFNEKYPHATKAEKFHSHIYFNIGRIISYAILGAAIGLVGSALALSPVVTGIITIAASVLMIIVGLQLLHIFPLLDRIQIKMPKSIAHKFYDASSQEQSSQSKSKLKFKSFLFGAGTFFLPCGFTQALQLYVLGRGDWLSGGLTMLFFALGTLPGLLSVGAISSLSKGSFQRYFKTFSAVLIIVLGVMNLPSGWTLTGATIGFNFDTSTIPELNNQNTPPQNIPAQKVGDNVNVIDGKQIIEMKVVGFDYSPDTFTLKQGVPVEWRINGDGAQGCAQVISVPALGITERLTKGKPTVITFTPSKIGQIKFSCSMGMAGPGMFKVI
ncbi:sulfite exporter TauE/SafE family protein [Candidatus Woesearchaeota archaeon]|nr:sulfite exporter TauE/SafE family protein [Candidatus Woesearchaeota archaeon]